MIDEAAPVVGPRRYRVGLNCRTDAVGTVIGLLIQEVEQPKMEKVGDAFRLTLVCMHDQLLIVLGVVMDHADNLIVAPFVPEVKMAPATFRAPKPTYVATPLQKEVTYLPAQRKRPTTGLKTSETGAGIAILSAFKDGGRVKHPADFQDAMAAAGYSGNGVGSTLARIVSEGDLVRVGRGAYRLPTTQDQLRVMEARDPSFSSGDE